MRWRAALLALALLDIQTAVAERLVTSISNHQVMVTQSFNGEELVLFGSVEPDAGGQINPNGYDVVATIAGPRQTLVTRRKDRVLGIWANVDSRMFIQVPSYLAVLTTRPIARIGGPDALREAQVGLDNFILTQRIGPDFADVVRDDPFRTNFIRLQNEKGLYLERFNAAVTFLSPRLFRANIPLPAEVPFGTYQVDVKLFANGTIAARDASSMEVIKVGFEQFVANTARNNGLFYGLACAAMAMATGWLASVIFRRD